VTVIFHRNRAGTPESGWWSSRLKACRHLDPPAAGDRLLVVAAHPDDETLGAGGLISAVSDLGCQIIVAVACHGEASHSRPRTGGASAVVELGLGEVRRALKTLAPEAELLNLRLPEGMLARHLEEMAGALDEAAARSTHILTPWIADSQPDHEACARIGAILGDRYGLTHWQYPIWAWHWADPQGGDLPWDQLRIFPLAHRERAAKTRAIAAYLSHQAPLSRQVGDEAILSPQALRYFTRPYETFVVAAAPGNSASYLRSLYREHIDPWSLDERDHERSRGSAACGLGGGVA
jgi:LmbE family N-acetylglucosaminyl deacetylase